MSRSLVFHPEAADELASIYDYIATKADPVTALSYVRDLRTYLIELCDFPERGTVREGAVAGLRIIGYRRNLSVAFAVRSDKVVVLGLYYAGRNIDLARLAARSNSKE